MEKEIQNLLERIKRDDESAFAQLCETYKTMTEAAVRRFSPSFKADGGSEYGLDDLRQYAAVALYRAAKTYEPDTDGKGKEVSFGLYAKICVNNALISVLRKHRSAGRKADGRRAGEREKLIAEKGDGTDPLDRLVYRESAGQLRKKIAAVLSDYETEIFDMYMAGKSVGEMARGLGKDEKSVSNAIYRVKAKIKGLIKNQ